MDWGQSPYKLSLATTTHIQSLCTLSMATTTTHPISVCTIFDNNNDSSNLRIHYPWQQQHTSNLCVHYLSQQQRLLQSPYTLSLTTTTTHPISVYIIFDNNNDSSNLCIHYLWQQQRLIQSPYTLSTATTTTHPISVYIIFVNNSDSSCLTNTLSFHLCHNPL